MWKVQLTKEAETELIANLKGGVFSIEDSRLLKLWTNQVELHGPEFIRNNLIWDDHSLHGKWEAHRSSCFGRAGRVIYRVVEGKILIEVVRVTGDHNYS